VIYAATNLGAFAVIIAVSRKTGSGEISSFGGLFRYAPGLTVMMTIFLASLAGIPPLGGWYAKFGAFKAAVDAAGGWGYGIAIVGAINAVIATAYYITVMREMWMKPAPLDDHTPIKVPGALQAAIALCGIATLLFGVLPGLIGKAGAITDLAGALLP
jgi:NADH-quinone oxidoreductase subunit N